MPDKLLKLMIRAVVRHINMDMAEFEYLKDKAAVEFQRVEERERKKKRLYVTVREHLEAKGQCRLIS